MINHLGIDRQPLSWLAKPALCGQRWMLVGGKKDTVKERGEASAFTS